MSVVKTLLQVFIALLLAGTVAAQNSPPGGAGSLEQLQQQVADAKGSGDNAWMLVSAALVLMMTGPGLALFYGGLVRRKNVLSTMMQSFAMMAIITVLWGLFSFSLCFGPGTALSAGSNISSSRE